MDGSRWRADSRAAAFVLIAICIVAPNGHAATPAGRAVSSAERPTAVPKTPANDLVLDLFGEEMLSVITGAERVESFSVIGAGQTREPGRDLTAAQIAEIQEILTDPGSFLFGIVKKCLFIPDAGLRFVSHLGEVEILFSSTCRTFLATSATGARLDSDGTRDAYEDYDPVAHRIDALFASVLGGERD